MERAVAMLEYEKLLDAAAGPGRQGLELPEASLNYDSFLESGFGQTRWMDCVGLLEGDFEVALVPRGNRRHTTGTYELNTTARALVLPITFKDLLERLRKEFRDSAAVERNASVHFGNVSVDFATIQITRCNKPVPLRKLEFELLRFLVRNPLRVLSRDELLNEVWGYDKYPCTRTVDNHILRLRQKLETDPSRPSHFVTVYGLGYKFVP